MKVRIICDPKQCDIAAAISFVTTIKSRSVTLPIMYYIPVYIYKYIQLLANIFFLEHWLKTFNVVQ
jgi:hypothetical protein